MSITKKFTFVLILSIFLIAIVNLLAFFNFYNLFLKSYLEEKIKSKEEITLDYINNIIKKQTIDDLDSYFSDIEIEFFELVNESKWNIKLDKQENVNKVINYLVKNWINQKYIEEIIPQNNFEKLLNKINDKSSAEYVFLNKLIYAIVLTNIIAIVLISFFIYMISRRIIVPIKQVTKDIKKKWVFDNYKRLEYTKKDEIWLLVQAINWLNSKLLVQDKIRSRLLADISHELKTPITSIRCYLEGINDWVIKLDDKSLKLLVWEMERLTDLVNTIMEFERFENKDLDLNLEKQDIKSLIKNIIKQHEKNLEKTNQKISVYWSDLNIEIDKNSFIQIVHNLIDNFRKYAWENTSLSIKLSEDKISFTDDGKWVNKNEIPYLKEKFYQSKKEKTWEAAHRWIWVWLSIIDKIILSHSWTYDIVSEKWKWFSFIINIKHD